MSNILAIDQRVTKTMFKRHSSCYTGSDRMVKLLIENGADINAANTENLTALILAIFLGIHENLKFFKENGALNQNAHTCF